MFAGTIKKRSDALWSKTSWEVRGPILPEARWTIICWRAHERFANSAPMISGVVEKTIALRNPSRCKMRSKRSSKLTPHNSIKASGAFATKIGRMSFIAREIRNGERGNSHLPRAARMAGHDAAIFHLMYPIASFRDRGIVCHQEQRHLVLLDNAF